MTTTKRVHKFWTRGFNRFTCQLGWPYRGPRSRLTGERIDYAYLRDALGSPPAYGLETNGLGPCHQPMAYGIIASAAAHHDDTPLMRTVADWLIENPASSAHPGWGLGWAYDAFRNGTVNPADTVYGITTAFAVDGLLCAYHRTAAPRYLDAVRSALDYYATYRDTRTGHFFYSDQAADRPYAAMNITAMLMGQYAHLATLTNHSAYSQMAADAYEAMKRDMIDDDSGLHWPYAHGMVNTKPNDLLHAAYNIFGLYLYERHVAPANPILPDATVHLRHFVHDDVYEFHHIKPPPPTARKARGWGIGMLLHVLSLVGDTRQRNEVYSHYVSYEFAPRRFSYIRDDQRHCPRVLAHLLLGVALHHQGRTGKPVYATRIAPCT